MDDLRLRQYIDLTYSLGVLFGEKPTIEQLAEAASIEFDLDIDELIDKMKGEQP